VRCEGGQGPKDPISLHEKEYKVTMMVSKEERADKLG
jgi:hypothetical protein